MELLEAKISFVLALQCYIWKLYSSKKSESQAKSYVAILSEIYVARITDPYQWKFLSLLINFSFFRT